jgi:hypothetical protein
MDAAAPLGKLAADGLFVGAERAEVCSPPYLHRVRRRTDGLRDAWQAPAPLPHMRRSKVNAPVDRPG